MKNIKSVIQVFLTFSCPEPQPIAHKDPYSCFPQTLPIFRYCTKLHSWVFSCSMYQNNQCTKL